MAEPLMDKIRQGFTPLNVLSPAQWRELAEHCQVQPLLAGQQLLRRGDQGRIDYYLLSGELELCSEQGVRQLLAGTAPASVQVSPAYPRQDDVRALTDVSVLAVDSAVCNALLLRHLMHQDLLVAAGTDQSELAWLEPLLTTPLFAKVPPANIKAMIARLEALDLPAGSEVIKQGERGQCCYFLKAGRAQVTRYEAGQSQVLAELTVGSCFGEEALLSDALRNASVSMLEDGSVLRLGRDDFFALIKQPVVAEVGLGEASRLLEQGAQWLDIRLLDEYELGHAAQARHMPLDLLRLKARMLSRHTVYVCYCDTGKRSASAAFLLAELGYNAYALRGGLNSLPALQRDALLGESGPGYVLRSGGKVERSC